MLVHSLISIKIDDPLLPIKEQCSSFIGMSASEPLLKSLPTSYSDIHRVKVRKRKQKQEFNTTFNKAFCEEQVQLFQRSVFCNGRGSYLSEADIGIEPFYIFPVDNFKFMYSKEVNNSSDDYKNVFESIFNEFGDTKGQELLMDLLRFTYTTSNLTEGIHSGAELIIYNIPCFYAVRAADTEYQELLNTINNIV